LFESEASPAQAAVSRAFFRKPVDRACPPEPGRSMTKVQKMIAKYQFSLAVFAAAMIAFAVSSGAEDKAGGAVEKSDAQVEKAPDAAGEKKSQVLEYFKKEFAKFDINGDGRISRIEHRGSGMVRFVRLDKDSDNSVSHEEFIAFGDPSPKVKELREKTFKAADINANGKISIDEWMDHKKRSFDRKDKDRDDFLSFKEFATTK
jgi:hypothetical protein